ncbi:MAG: hypothetical protein ACYDH9_14225 [Limisphaerales bacterium]
MKPTKLFGSAAVSAVLLCGSVNALDLDKLTVLYIGDLGTPRAQQFTGFLKQNVGRIETASRRAFKPERADGVDVVLLDWPQSARTREEWQEPSPLGDRAAWSKPTVLLGSAGLNLAVVWKVRGGSG